MNDIPVFQIGFNKCGTRSIARFFERHGLRSAHWMQGDLAKSLKSDIAAGRRPLADWRGIDVFTDIEYVDSHQIIEGYKYFKELYQAYPSAVFLLNTRNCEDWIWSRNSHKRGVYTEKYRKYYGLSTSEEVFDLWRLDWHKHHLSVLEFFAKDKRDNLVIWDIGAPNFCELEHKLGFSIEPDFWAKEGATKKRLGL